MAEKNYIEVNLMGKNYILGGTEDEAYLQRVATYVNGKEAELKRMQGYLRQNADFQHLTLLLNMADDYFKTLRQVENLKAKQEQLEEEIYSLKHDLISGRYRHDEKN